MNNYGGQRGAGIFEGTANNSILHGNYLNGNVIENFGARYWWQVTLNHCCTTPLPGSGGANFTNAPLFVDQAAGNFRLQSNSPCINMGNNGYVGANSTDLDGNRRIVGGTVDVGAYEFVPPDLAAFLAWLEAYGIPSDGSADLTDTDGDRLNNWQEWIAGTVPTNALSTLRLLNPAPDSTGLVVSWESVSNRTYFLDRAIQLSGAPTFLTLATNITGLAGATSFTDTNAVGAGPYFYRIGVQTGSNQFLLAQSIIPFTWLQQYGLPVDGSADLTDTDGDRANNWQEWMAWTVPTNHESTLRMLPLQLQSNGTLVRWQSVSGQTYHLERASHPDTPFSLIHSNITGQAVSTSFADTNAIGTGPFLYRVGVR
jgi:hypothetical protein